MEHIEPRCCFDASEYLAAPDTAPCPVTLCNMAETYARRDSEDARIGECMERAWEYLNAPDLAHDGYHAFTISKCAPSFDYFGYFIYAKMLKERAERIYGLS